MAKTKAATKSQIDNAVKWIDELPNYNQGKGKNSGKLGSKEKGYCCLGVGCVVTGTPFDPNDGESYEFTEAVGLNAHDGDLGFGAYGCNTFFGQYELTSVNDDTNAGFKRISNLLKTKPHWMFEPEVAKGIEEHYKQN